MDVPVDAQGCRLMAPQLGLMGVRSQLVHPAESVIIADFIPEEAVGEVDVNLACTDAKCIDVSVHVGGFSVDKRSGDRWTNLAQGGQQLFTPRLRIGEVNRLVLTFRGGEAEFFVNGYRLAHVRPTVAVTEGFLDFHLDEYDELAPEHVHLRRLDAFAAA